MIIAAMFHAAEPQLIELPMITEELFAAAVVRHQSRRAASSAAQDGGGALAPGASMDAAAAPAEALAADAPLPAGDVAGGVAALQRDAGTAAHSGGAGEQPEADDADDWEDLKSLKPVSIGVIRESTVKNLGAGLSKLKHCGVDDIDPYALFEAVRKVGGPPAVRCFAAHRKFAVRT